MYNVLVTDFYHELAFEDKETALNLGVFIYGMNRGHDVTVVDENDNIIYLNGEFLNS